MPQPSTDRILSSGRFHAYLFLAASLLSAYPASATVASPDQVFRPLLALSVLLILFQNLLSRIFRKDGGALLTSVTVLTLFASPKFFLAAALYSATAVIAIGLIGRFRGRRMSVFAAHAVLSAVAAVLFAIHAVPFARMLAIRARQADRSSAPAAKLTVPQSRPDIYFLVLDGYARADVLEELYAFDNSEFLEALASRGFVIPSSSRSNYAKTALSVASALNMRYLHSLDEDSDLHRYWWLLSPYLDHSDVRRALEQIGYISVSLPSGWDLTDNTTSDIYAGRRRPALNDFESFFLSRTPSRAISPLLERLNVAPSYRTHRETIVSAFGGLRDVADLAGPQFVVSHVFAGHPPFVFDADGNPADPEYAFAFHDANNFPLSDREYRDAYVEQLRFINKQLIGAIDAILSASDTPPIIALQADHGPRMLGDFRAAETTCLKESFSAFSAYLLPNAPRELIPQDVTAVNAFRIILNHYFDLHVPVLESRHFYDEADADLVDVTHLVETCEAK